MNGWKVTTLVLLLALNALAQTNAPSIEQKLSKIILPRVEFREADGADVLEFLFDAANLNNKHQPPIGIVYGIGSVCNNLQRTVACYKLEDGTKLNLPSLTVTYSGISVLETISRVTKTLGLSYKFEGNRFSLFTKDGKRILRKESVVTSDGTGGKPTTPRP